ncbi:MAG: 30S ribosomal protein S19e [Methanobacteriota archaeon]|jgi:small subunit ribosomal protein S19e|nr:MAG: 30S ribosomal protein S19e [Euryarchaeota archaeon]
MTTVYDVPVELFIKQAAEDLKQRPEIKPPAWSAFAKTGVHKQMPPENPDWWFVRSASVLRCLYMDGPVGVQRMRSAYGGKRDRGSSPYQFRKGSGSVIRKILQQLEAAGYVEKGKTGRRISSGGMAFLDGVAQSIKPKAIESTPGLDRY